MAGSAAAVHTGKGKTLRPNPPSAAKAALWARGRGREPEGDTEKGRPRDSVATQPSVQHGSKIPWEAPMVRWMTAMAYGHGLEDLSQ